MPFLAILPVALQQDLFLPPFQLQSGVTPISVDIGHAAPLYVDFDGDGKRDLLVGQFGGGRLRIYKNKGSDTDPVFDGFKYFQAGGRIAHVNFG